MRFLNLFALFSLLCSITHASAFGTESGFGCDVDWIPSTHNPADIVVEDGYVYVLNSAAQSGLEIYEITQSGAPELVGFVATPGSSRSLRVVGNLAFASREVNQGMIDIIDLSDHSMPMIVGSYSSDGQVPNFDVADGVLYIPHFWVGDQVQGLEVVDVSDPSAPVLMGLAEFESKGVQLKPFRLDVDGDIGFLNLVSGSQTGHWILAVDFSDPVNPVELGGFFASDKLLRDIHFTDDVLYLLGDRIELVDITDYARMSRLSLVVLEEPHSQMEVHGDEVYITLPSGVKRLNTLNKTNPVLEERYSTPGGKAVGSVLIGDQLLAADYFTGLHLVDLDGGCSEPNPADMNRDGFLDFFDVSILVQYNADLNQDGDFDFNDISAFLSLLQQGI